MKNIILIFLFLFTISCSLNKVNNNHGVLSLEKKFNKIKVKQSNSNDIFSIFGPPSTKSNFDTNILFYIERKKTNRSIFKLGNQKIVKNNVVVLELDSKGLLIKKEIFDLNNMNKYKFSQNATEKQYTKDSNLSGIFRSLREKIDAPSKRKSNKKK